MSINLENLSNTINNFYDSHMYSPDLLDFYQQSDYVNLGYWDDEVITPKEACDLLMSKLLDFIPEKQGDILDVACGKGETTRYLTKFYSPDKITGINISEKQLSDCRKNLPATTFQLMDATSLQFENNSFDTVICVEAAFHFNTRERFLKEALRVLKPGGYLVLSDILLTSEGEENFLHRVEDENYVQDVDAYEALCRQVGFESIAIVDATENCWRRHYRYAVEFVHEKFLNHQLDFSTLQHYMSFYYRQVEALKYYLLVSARKKK
ncbi:MAG: class I SAM-dependent methyltransferase [Calothrix sp. MO_167.B12]|nr:class I SAM-dependent methyltransferase [Calothrix sp. MO_167.B12]